MKYLYGASVQGIQSFIFQTNKLTEIIGASQLVEDICTDFFKGFLKEDFKDENLILGAAGNIKYLFDSHEACERVVRGFPKHVMLYAPGLTISQAVVLDTGESNDFEKLEKLLKIQRNKAVSVTQGISLMALENARRTGGIVVERDRDNDYIDQAQKLKREAERNGKATLEGKLLGAVSKRRDAFPNEMDHIKDAKNWVAVIHADGNNLGQLLMSMSEKIKSEYSDALKKFSQLLDDSTIAAAKRALEATFVGDELRAFRPIVLGGDDLTVLIRADKAVRFTELFLTYFEEITRQKFSTFYPDLNIIPREGLTACAGIAYIKSTYPFHYGVELAETLCKQAKKMSKKDPSAQTPASLMFHKVHSSFVPNYEDLIIQELTARRQPASDEDKAGSLYFNYGPYFISPQSGDFSTVGQLQKWVDVVKRPESPRSGLRNWLTDVKSNPVKAGETMARIREITDKHYTEKLSLNNVEVKRDDGKWYTHLFDVLSLASIQS